MMSKKHKIKVRKKSYVDNKIQGLMLVALVIMEVALANIAVWYLYVQFHGIIDEQIYQIHIRHDDASSLTPLVWLILKVVSILLIVNVAALIVADRIWVYFVRKVIITLCEDAEKTRELDFRELPSRRMVHPTLEYFSLWREQKNAQGIAMKTELQRLEQEFSELCKTNSGQPQH